VAHTNTLVLLLREPIQRPAGSPPITQRSFPSASSFAASFGGSVDYRITDRLSYRIVQPELLLNRSGSMGAEIGTSTTSDCPLELCSRPGVHRSVNLQGRIFSFGVVGGAALTDAFGMTAPDSSSAGTG